MKAARTAGRNWYLFDIAGMLDRLAWRRYINDPSAAPPWWSKYPLPPALAALTPEPDTQFLTANGQGGRRKGGLMSLDGIHPTTVAYGIVAQELIDIMQLAGVEFTSPNGAPRTQPVTVDFDRLIGRDTLVNAPPQNVNSTLDIVGWLDQTVDVFSQLFIHHSDGAQLRSDGRLSGASSTSASASPSQALYSWVLQPRRRTNRSQVCTLLIAQMMSRARSTVSPGTQRTERRPACRPSPAPRSAVRRRSTRRWRRRSGSPAAAPATTTDITGPSRCRISPASWPYPVSRSRGSVRLPTALTSSRSPNGDRLLVADKAHVVQPLEQVRLGSAGVVDGLFRDAGRLRDRRDAGRSVSLLDEETLGRVQDAAFGGPGRLVPDGADVRPG